MKAQDLDLVRSLVASAVNALAAADQILNPESEPEPESAKPTRRYLGDDDEPKPGD